MRSRVVFSLLVICSFAVTCDGKSKNFDPDSAESVANFLRSIAPASEADVLKMIEQLKSDDFVTRQTAAIESTVGLIPHRDLPKTSSGKLSRTRARQMYLEGAFGPEVTEFLRGAERLSIINVIDAEGSTAGNGHGYFRSSPWVSSDVLATLAFGLGPGERGLVRPTSSRLKHGLTGA